MKLIQLLPPGTNISGRDTEMKIKQLRKNKIKLAIFFCASEKAVRTKHRSCILSIEARNISLSCNLTSYVKALIISEIESF